MLRKISTLLTAAIALTSLVGCKNEGSSSLKPLPQDSVYSSSVSDVFSEENSVPYVEGDGINPLTGEDGYNNSAYGKRPVSIMVNNLKGSLPQYGIEAADIIYEVPVEAGITRLMAIYADYTNVPDVCSVRSCRYYYPIIALGFDAIYCHIGMDMSIARETLMRTGIDRFDGDSDLFLRDTARSQTMASEHTWYLNGSAIADKIEASFRTDANSGNYGGGLIFDESGGNTNINGTNCSEITLNFSNQYYSGFQYDESSGKYMKMHSGTPHVDGATENQLCFTNVFAIQTNISERDCKYLMDVEIVGSGTGYWASGGKVVPIKWEKLNETLPMKLYSEDGTPLVLNPGKSYFGVIGSEKNIAISE